MIRSYTMMKTGSTTGTVCHQGKRIKPDHGPTPEDHDPRKLPLAVGGFQSRPGPRGRDLLLHVLVRRSGCPVAQRHHGQDGEPDGDQRGDRRGEVHPLNERLAGGLEDGRSEPVGQLPGDGHGAAERVARDRRRGGRHLGREAVRQLAPVDRHADAAQEGDAEGAAELGAGLRDPRGGPGGADPTISSVVRPNTGARPSEISTEPATRGASWPAAATWVSATSPAAESAKPPPMTNAGRTRCTIRGASWDPTMNPKADGNDHMPAWSGESPATNPASMDATATDPRPSWAISLRP